MKTCCVCVVGCIDQAVYSHKYRFCLLHPSFICALLVSHFSFKADITPTGSWASPSSFIMSCALHVHTFTAVLWHYVKSLQSTLVSFHSHTPLLSTHPWHSASKQNILSCSNPFVYTMFVYYFLFTPPYSLKPHRPCWKKCPAMRPVYSQWRGKHRSWWTRIISQQRTSPSRWPVCRDSGGSSSWCLGGGHRNSVMP